MESTAVNLGGKDMQFVLTIEPNSGIPMWATEIDELWCNIVGANLYSFCKLHGDKLITSNLDNPKDFAASMGVFDFKGNLFPGQAALFHDVIFMLKEMMAKYNKGIAPEKMYVSFFSTSPEGHYLNAALDKDLILIGARLGKLDNSKTIIL